MLEIFAGAVLLFFGWALDQEPDNLIVLQADPNGEVGALVVTTTEGSQVLDTLNAGVAVSRSGQLGNVQTYSDDELQRFFSSALAAQPPAPKSYLLYFDTGASELNAAARATFADALADIAERQLVRVAVIGHTDRVGSAEVNARLALERAEQVRTLLLDEGVLQDAVTAVSHGENDTLVPTDDGVAEPRNRRVEILVR